MHKYCCYKDNIVNWAIAAKCYFAINTRFHSILTLCRAAVRL